MTAPDDFQLPVARDAVCVDECYMHGLPGAGAPHPHGPGSCRQSCSLLRRPPPAQEHPGIAPFPVTAGGDTVEDALEELAARLEIILHAAGVDPWNNVETPR